MSEEEMCKSDVRYIRWNCIAFGVLLLGSLVMWIITLMLYCNDVEIMLFGLNFFSPFTLFIPLFIISLIGLLKCRKVCIEYGCLYKAKSYVSQIKKLLLFIIVFSILSIFPLKVGQNSKGLNAENGSNYIAVESQKNNEDIITVYKKMGFFVQELGQKKSPTGEYSISYSGEKDCIELTVYFDETYVIPSWVHNIPASLDFQWLRFSEALLSDD